jgi:putative ABC transport system permease protein
MSTASQYQGSSLRVIAMVAKLAAGTLRHEWIPSLCLALSLAAVLCPLLLVIGLKHGTVTTLRNRLTRNPANLELRPVTSDPLDARSLARLRTLPGVSFVVPTTRVLGSAVTLRAGAVSTGVDLMPTGAGDPLLETYGCAAPQEGELVLSSTAAAKLGKLQPGDRVMLDVTRFKGTIEKVSTELRIVGILPVEATVLTSGYVPLLFQEMVEQFKDGLAVSRLGWPGDLPLAMPEYDGIIVLSKTVLPTQLVSRLCLETGFSSARELRVGEQGDVSSLNQSDLAVRLLCYNSNGPQGTAALSAARDILRGQNAIFYPWSSPSKITLEYATQAGKMTGSLSVTLGAKAEETWANSGAEPNLPVVWVHTIQPEGETLLETIWLDRTLRLPVLLRHDAAISRPDDFRASAALTGVLRLLHTRVLVWDAASRSILLGRRAHSGFRLYAHSLEEVEPVRLLLQQQGIECRSESSQIARIASLDRDLSLVFGLISLFGMGGACASLALSLYGAVERRRRDYGMLRTMGLRRGWLLLLPMLEAMTLATLAFALGLGSFYGLAGLINRLFAEQSAAGEEFCRLPAIMLVYAYTATCVLAAIASLGAALRLTTVSPADAIKSS